jgi:DNA-binding MarR family transcriptional regulator
MRSRYEHTDTSADSSHRELRLLTEVERRPEATQREFARRVGIALGMTNLLLHNLVQKGYVRVSQADWRRRLYALTPEGLSRKIQLTLAYIHRFLDQYRRVRQTLRDELELEQLNAESRIAIYGTGEFAELVYLGLMDLGIDDIEVFGPGMANGTKFLGMPVQELPGLLPDYYDRVVVAFPGEAKDHYLALRRAGAPPEKLILFFTNPEALSTQNGRFDAE